MAAVAREIDETRDAVQLNGFFSQSATPFGPNEIYSI